MERTVVVFGVRGVSESKVNEEDIGDAITDEWVYGGRGPGGGYGPVHDFAWSPKRNEVAVIPSSFRTPLTELMNMDSVIGDAIEDVTGGTVEELVVTTTEEVSYMGGTEVSGVDEMPPALADTMLDALYDAPGEVPEELLDSLWDVKQRDDDG